MVPINYYIRRNGVPMNITPATGYGHMNSSHSTTFKYLDNMAEGGTLERKSLEQLEKEITCAVCQEHYTEPKILLCLHCYCKKCVYVLALRTGSRQPFLSTVSGGDHPPRGRRKTQNSFLCQLLQVQLLCSTESPRQGGGNV